MDGTEVGIYKRKQESKKTRKQELDQERDQEKWILFFFSVAFLAEFLFSCFLDRFLGRGLVSLIAFLVKFLFSCFLTLLFSFINSHLWRCARNNDAEVGWIIKEGRAWANGKYKYLRKYLSFMKMGTFGWCPTQSGIPPYSGSPRLIDVMNTYNTTVVVKVPLFCRNFFLCLESPDTEK